MLTNESTPQLRRFSPQDAASVLAWPQSLTEARWWAGPQTSWPIPPEAFQRWHDDPDAHPYILGDRATPLGYGELWIDAAEREVELARLIVAPGQRGQGVGASLVRLLLDEARRTGYPRAFLRVFPDNQAAISCYLRAGFTPVSPAEQQSFNHAPADRVCLDGQLSWLAFAVLFSCEMPMRLRRRWCMKMAIHGSAHSAVQPLQRFSSRVWMPAPRCARRTRALPQSAPASFDPRRRSAGVWDWPALESPGPRQHGSSAFPSGVCPLPDRQRRCLGS